MKGNNANGIDSLDRYCASLYQKKLPEKLTTNETNLLFSEYHRLERIEETESVKLRKRQIYDRVVFSCLPYVVKLAQDFSKGLSDRDLLMELVAAGNEGLCKAFFKFNPVFGAPFHYYAATWIKANIRIVLKSRFSLVKGSPPNSVNKYYDNSSSCAFPSISNHSELDELNTDNSSTLLTLMKTTLKKFPPELQIIFNLIHGSLDDKPRTYTKVAAIMGESISVTFVKSAEHFILKELKKSVKGKDTTQVWN